MEHRVRKKEAVHKTLFSDRSPLLILPGHILGSVHHARVQSPPATLPPPCPPPGRILGSVHHARAQSPGPRWSTARTCTSKVTVMNDDALARYKNGVTEKHVKAPRWVHTMVHGVYMRILRAHTMMARA